MAGDHPTPTQAVDETRPAAFPRIVSRLAQIQRRLFLARLLRCLSLDLLIFLSIAVVLVAAERLFSLGFGALNWLAVGLGTAVIISLLRVFVWGRVHLADAARAADGRLGLKDRVATAVYLEGRRGPSPADSWREIICSDGASHLERVNVAERFPVRPPRSAWWILAPLVVAGGILAFVPAIDLLGIEARRRAVAEERKAVEAKKEELDKQLEEIEKKAEEERFEDLKKLLASLRDRPAEPSDPPEKARQQSSEGGEPKKEALIELARKEDLIRKSLSAEKYEALKQTLDDLQKAGLKEFDLTRRLRQALKEGDLKKALDEMKSLERDLQSLKRKSPSELTAKERQRLQKLSEELSRLARDARGLQRLSRTLSAAAAGLDAQSLPQALDSLQLSQEELESLARQLDQMQLMKRTMELVRWTKEDLRNLQSLTKLQSHWCPECGKRKGLPRPGEKPGST